MAGETGRSVYLLVGSDDVCSLALVSDYLCMSIVSEKHDV